jgi:hypothetical protein
VSEEGRLRITTSAQTANTTTASDAATIAHRHQLCRGGFSFASRRTLERRRFSKLAEGLNRTEASFINNPNPRISS